MVEVINMTKNFKRTWAVMGVSAIILLGAGCALFQTTTKPIPSTPLPPVVVAPADTILISIADTTTYCNGADMDSAGYRATITQEQKITLPKNQTVTDHVKSVIVAATTGMCKQALQQLAITVTNGVVHIPPIDGWAGMSIAMCSCTPQVETNALRIPGITSVVWE